MKENYFKSFFKAFRCIPILIVLFGFIGAGYLTYGSTVLSENYSYIFAGILLILFPSIALLGLSKLKFEKVGFIDFLRVTGALSAIITAIFAFAGTRSSSFQGVVFIVSGVVMLIEAFIRAKFADDDATDGPVGNYFGALAGTFSPLLILLAGVVIAVLGFFAAKNNVIGDFFGGENMKFPIIGIMIAMVIVFLIPVFDRHIEVTIIDFLMASFFVGFVYLTFLAIPELSSSAFKLLFVGDAGLGVAITIRALSYNKGKGYDNPSHKVRTYFKQAYEKYDITLALLIAMLLIVFIGVLFAFLVGGNFIANRLNKGAAETIFMVLAIGFAVLLIVLTFIFRKFKSTKIEKVDFLLIMMIFGSTIAIPLLVIALIEGIDVFGTTSILVVLITYLVLFVFAAIIQIVRLHNFDPLFALVGDNKYKVPEEEKPAEEETPEEEAEEEEENDDPFALTEEDEAIYESVYGKEETEEEAEEEVVEEEVQEEQPEEEYVEYVEEEEQPEEYVEYVEEEVQEEQPQEEVVEEESEEEAEEEEDAEDEEEVEYEDDGEVYEEIPQTKESAVIVQDFQIVDEEGKPKKIKRRFNSKMMFAPYETKEYYNEIKNYLQSYRAKGRYSARCESYRYKGLVAKVALGGKSIKVFLALDPSFIDENPKYHLKNVADKKQYQEVPVMIKVRSPRALKYFKELVDIMMAARGVKAKRNYQEVNYMPQLIPNGEAIMATLGMSTDYLHDSMNVHSIPADMPDNLEDYIPMIGGEELEEEEIEATVYLDTLCNHFEDGDEITIDVLKSLHIVTRGNVMRIKARGTLDKKLIIYAEYFDADALKMLMCTNCTAIKIVR